jgi:hypothetical protein
MPTWKCSVKVYHYIIPQKRNQLKFLMLIRQNKQISQLQKLLTEVLQNKVMLLSICSISLAYMVIIGGTTKINYIRSNSRKQSPTWEAKSHSSALDFQPSTDLLIPLKAWIQFEWTVFKNSSIAWNITLCSPVKVNWHFEGIWFSKS